MKWMSIVPIIGLIMFSQSLAQSTNQPVQAAAEANLVPIPPAQGPSLDTACAQTVVKPPAVMQLSQADIDRIVEQLRSSVPPPVIADAGTPPSAPSFLQPYARAKVGQRGCSAIAVAPSWLDEDDDDEDDDDDVVCQPRRYVPDQVPPQVQQQPPVVQPPPGASNHGQGNIINNFYVQNNPYSNISLAAGKNANSRLTTCLPVRGQRRNRCDDRDCAGTAVAGNCYVPVGGRRAPVYVSDPYPVHAAKMSVRQVRLNRMLAEEYYEPGPGW